MYYTEMFSRLNLIVSLLPFVLIFRLGSENQEQDRSAMGDNYHTKEAQGHQESRFNLLQYNIPHSLGKLVHAIFRKKNG